MLYEVITGQQESAEITVFAAASTSDLITAAAAAYTAETGSYNFV